MVTISSYQLYRSVENPSILPVPADLRWPKCNGTLTRLGRDSRFCADQRTLALEWGTHAPRASQGRIDQSRRGRRHHQQPRLSPQPLNSSDSAFRCALAAHQARPRPARPQSAALSRRPRVRRNVVMLTANSPSVDKRCGRTATRAVSSQCCRRFL
jgi:hypothetical protein